MRSSRRAGMTRALPGVVTGNRERGGRGQASAAARGFAVIVAAAAAGVLAAGCGSASTTPNPPPSGQPVSSAPASSAPATQAAPQAGGGPDSCSVITQAEAGSALGQQVQPPIKGKATVEGGVACVFYGPNVPPGASPDIPYADTVRVVLVTGPNAKKYFDDYRSKVNAQPISGLGDSAYYDGYASISVLKGDAYVRIAVGIFHNLGPEKTLAADALPRM